MGAGQTGGLAVSMSPRRPEKGLQHCVSEDMVVTALHAGVKHQQLLVLQVHPCSREQQPCVGQVLMHTAGMGHNRQACFAMWVTESGGSCTAPRLGPIPGLRLECAVQTACQLLVWQDHGHIRPVRNCTQQVDTSLQAVTRHHVTQQSQFRTIAACANAPLLRGEHHRAPALLE